MIALIDYGMGNLHSAVKAFEYLGQQVAVTHDDDIIRTATHVVLPGVGAFSDALKSLQQTRMDLAVKEAVASGKPFLGICLGMQLMFTQSDEGGLNEGLGIVDGKVTLMDAGGEKIPHMGWNEVHAACACPLLEGISGRNFYFVHSYCAQDVHTPAAAGVTHYGNPFVSVAWDGKRAFGTQFHPEKSGEAGLKLLANFIACTGGSTC